jgi:hypothetical protein
LSVRGQVCGVQRPLLFQVNGSLRAASPFPRPGPGEPGSPTSSVLWRRYDFPLAHTWFLMDSVPGPTCSSFRFVLAEALPLSVEVAQQPWAFGQPAAPFPACCTPWARAGHHRFPGDPSYALALLQDPGRADKTSPLTASSILPPGTEHRRPQRIIISRLTQGFSIRCLRFKSGVAAAPARLASGWRAAPLPGGGRTLWTALKGFRLHRHPPFQDFACRNQFESRLRAECGRTSDAGEGPDSAHGLNRSRGR